MTSYFHLRILDNSLQRISWFLVIILLAFIFSRYLSKLLSKIIYRLITRFTKASYGDKFSRLVLQPLQYFILLIIIRTAIETLVFPESWKINIWDFQLQHVLNELLWMLVLLSFSWLLLRVVDYVAYIFQEKAALTASKTDDQLVPFVKDASKIFIIVNTTFVLLGVVFGLDLTSLLAGLGIGGLAVAFAAQESIKDIFGSITVFLDKPFVVGDVVAIGGVEGTIEKVGIRSTRIRTADRTIVTVPNKLMLENSVDNLTQRPHRRVKQVIGVTYETTADQIKAIIEELKDYFKNSSDMHEEYLVIFDEYGESSLNILIFYYVPFMPFFEHLNRKEEVNFKIMEIVARHGSNFAFPVREIKMDPELFKRP